MATDAFTYSNGALPTVSGGAWETIAPTYHAAFDSVVASNALGNPGTNDLVAYALRVSGASTADHSSQLVVTLTSNFAARGVVCRGVKSGGQLIEGYHFEWNTSGDYVLVDVNSYTPVATVSAGGSSGTRTLKIEADGTSIKCYANGVEVISHTDVLGYTAGAGIGVIAVKSAGVTTGDDWEGGDLATPVTGVALGTWSGWSATSSATVTHPASALGTWAGWSATASATVSHQATAAGTWNGWNGVASATVTRSAVAAATWNGWSATVAGVVVRGAVCSATWSGWSATASGTITPPADDPVALATWAGWSAAASATITHPATGQATWNGWSCTAVGVVTRSATAEAVWGGWSAQAEGGVPGAVMAVCTATWYGWLGTALVRPKPLTRLGVLTRNQAYDAGAMQPAEGTWLSKRTR